LAHRIILADTQVIFRTGAARVLAMEDDLRVVAQCADLAQLKAAVGSLRSSIAVFPAGIADDLDSVLGWVADAKSKSVVIVEHGAALADGVGRRAEGIVTRSVGGAQLVDCLRRVGAGERWQQGAEVKAVAAPDRVGARVLERLTPKELQIVALVSDGGKNREIASQLGTKEQVIKNYLRSIYDKMGVSDRLELALFTTHHPVLAAAAELARQELQRVV
jgi:DNA-binding NarL/FixJ family response regulator